MWAGRSTNTVDLSYIPADSTAEMAAQATAHKQLTLKFKDVLVSTPKAIKKGRQEFSRIDFITESDAAQFMAEVHQHHSARFKAAYGMLDNHSAQDRLILLRAGDDVAALGHNVDKATLLLDKALRATQDTLEEEVMRVLRLHNAHQRRVQIVACHRLNGTWVKDRYVSYHNHNYGILWVEGVSSDPDLLGAIRDAIHAFPLKHGHDTFKLNTVQDSAPYFHQLVPADTHPLRVENLPLSASSSSASAVLTEINEAVSRLTHALDPKLVDSGSIAQLPLGAIHSINVSADPQRHRASSGARGPVGMAFVSSKADREYLIGLASGLAMQFQGSSFIIRFEPCDKDELTAMEAKLSAQRKAAAPGSKFIDVTDVDGADLIDMDSAEHLQPQLHPPHAVPRPSGHTTEHQQVGAPSGAVPA
jgi:hypothetical protein